MTHKEQDRLARISTYLLLLQAVIEASDEPLLPAEIRSQNIANLTKRMQEAMIKKVNLLMPDSDSAKFVGDEVFNASTVLLTIAREMQKVDPAKVEHLDSEIQTLFNKYTK